MYRFQISNLNSIILLRFSLFSIFFGPLALNAAVFTTYHYKEYNYNNKNGWIIGRVVDDPKSIVTSESRSITILENDVTDIYTFVGEYKVIADNDLKYEMEIECLDRERKSCRISFTRLKISGKSFLNVFYISKFWRQYHISFFDGLDSYKTASWSPRSFELPDEPVKFYDAAVKSIQDKGNKSVKSYFGINESDQYRALVYFSNKGVTAFIYDNGGNLVTGLSQMRELNLKVLKTGYAEYGSEITLGNETRSMKIVIIDGVNGPTYFFSCYIMTDGVLDWSFLLEKK